MKNLNNSTHPSYRPDIDGLRAIAVLSVVIYHAFPTGALKGGFIGVDIFFVISGFLISLILLGDLNKNRFSFVVFYSRRILRIFPALLTVLIICFLAGYLSLFPDEYKQIGKHAAGGAGFIANLMLWSEVGYFDNASELKPLLHLWSLGVEEQFYIVWPPLMLVIWKSNLRFLKLALIIGVTSFLFSVYCTYTNPVQAFYSPLSRLWELLAGGVLAYLVVHNQYIVRSHHNLQSFTGITLIVVALFVIQKTSKFPGLLALLPVLGAFLLISAGPNGWVNRKILSNKILVSIGLISYPLYLWHWPLLSFLRIGDADGTYRDVPMLHRSIAVILAVFLAWITYRFIERPIRFGGNKQIWLPTLGVLGIASCLFGVTIFFSDGFPGRIQLNPPTASILFSEYPHPLRNEACENQYPELKSSWSCLLSKPQKANVAIIGDSHAHQYYYSLAKKLPDSTVLNFSYPGCLPFSNNTACNEKLDETIKFIKNNKSIDTIILTGYFSFLGAGFKYENIEGFRVANDLNEENKRAFSESAIKLLSTLTSLNKSVIIFIDIPDLVFKPRSCVVFQNKIMAFLRGGIKSKSINDCGILAQEFYNRNKSHDNTLSEILSKYPKIEIFNPRPLFCNGIMCTAYENNHFMYWNSDHLTIEGTDMVIDALLKDNNTQLGRMN